MLIVSFSFTVYTSRSVYPDLTDSDAVRDNRLRFMMLPPKRTKYDTVFQPEESK